MLQCGTLCNLVLAGQRQEEQNTGGSKKARIRENVASNQQQPGVPRAGLYNIYIFCQEKPKTLRLEIFEMFCGKCAGFELVP